MKQREKWTEDEHALFLEALELHGRPWRRIEGKLEGATLHLAAKQLAKVEVCFGLQSTLGRRQQCRSEAMLRSSSQSWKRSSQEQ